MREANLSMERRTSPRVSIKTPVKYRLEEDQKIFRTIEEWRNSGQNATALDLSLEGMCIVVDKPIRVGEVLCLEIHCLSEDKTLTVYASVRWANCKGAGLRFLMMKDDEVDCLKSLLERSSVALK